MSLSQHELATIKEAIEIIKSALEAFGGCDHDVGICSCGEERVLADLIAIASQPAQDDFLRERRQLEQEWCDLQKLKATEKNAVLSYVTNLAVNLWEKHYAKDAPDWKPLADALGVLTQIDNMVAGLVKPARVPMTNGDIKRFLSTNCIYLGKSFGAMLTDGEAVEVVKFIEAHHGIGGKP